MHLTTGQKAALAVELKPMFEEKAKERQGYRSDIKESLPECKKGQSRDQAGKAVGVSGRTVAEAEAIPATMPDNRPTRWRVTSHAAPGAGLLGAG